MSEKQNSEKTASERREEWEDSQFSNGNDVHYWDYAMSVANLLEETLESLEIIVGPENAAGPLHDLLERAATSEYQKNSASWRVMIEDTLETGTMWPICDQLWHAAQYGIYGVPPASVALSERTSWIEDLVAKVGAFSERKIVSALGPNNAILRIARITVSRRALDLGEGEVDLASLAILGGVSEGRLRNLLSGSEAALARGANGGVIASSALAWLQKRKGFYNSIWMHEEPDTDRLESSVDMAPVNPETMIFVPVARDGSLFRPDLKRAGSYQIGGKGEEHHFEDFETALTALNAMPVPRWRRPNEQGNWGIVSGVFWQRVERNL